MYNCILDEFTHMIWEQRIEELKFMLPDENIDYNDVDRLGKTLLLQAIECVEFYEENGVLKPQKRWLDFIRWLLEQGADPKLPENNTPIEYTLECESDTSAQRHCVCDMTDILLLLKKHGADTSEYEEYISGDIQDRLDYKWDKKR